MAERLEGRADDGSESDGVRGACGGVHADGTNIQPATWQDGRAVG